MQRRSRSNGRLRPENIAAAGVVLIRCWVRTTELGVNALAPRFVPIPHEEETIRTPGRTPCQPLSVDARERGWQDEW